MTSTAQEQALTIGHRLLDPATVTTTVPGRSGASLAHGLVGTALLHARLSTADPVFAAAAAAHWTQAAELIKQSPDGTPGIFGDRGGLAASLIIGSPLLPDPRPHRPAAQRAAQWLAASALRLAPAVTAPTWATYDVINRLAGIGRVLLAARADGHQESEPGLRAALQGLTRMLAPSASPRPAWWIPTRRHPASVKAHESGAAATGMAHGVAGPLAFLSIAWSAGHKVDGQEAAILNAAEWLLRWRIPGTSRWPPTVTGDQLDGRISPPVTGRTDAWCYGTPGISRALTLAGQALTDLAITQTGTTALASLAERPPGQWDTEGPALCHGTSGVLQIASHNAEVAEIAASHVTRAFDEHETFGFTTQPGLLTGAAGTALALADHSKLPAALAPTAWDALLLLS